MNWFMQLLHNIFWFPYPDCPDWMMRYVDNMIAIHTRYRHIPSSKGKTIIDDVISCYHINKSRQYAIKQIIARMPEQVPAMMRALEKYPRDKKFAEKLVILM